MTAIFYLIIITITFIAMEGVAWAAHKYLMHGALWSWHEDHHINGPGFFEKNDRFFLVFALPSITFFAIGGFTDQFWAVFVGLGILLYGIAYFLIHDVFIHQRFKWLRNAKGPYFKAIRRAHKIHHKHLTKEHGECFGMLFVPRKYFKQFE